MRYFFACCLVVVLASCQFGGGQRIAGNGKIKTEDRKVDNFDEVEVSGSVQVHLIQSTANAVKLETDENLMEYLVVENDGGTLKIHSKNDVNLDPSKEIIAYVSAPSWKRVDVSGACDIIGNGPITGSQELSLEVSGSGSIQMDVSVPTLKTHLSGSGKATLKGNVESFEADLSGSGELHCFELNTQNTSLDLSGASNVEVNAQKTLDVEASGSSTVRYKGNPSLKQQMSGAGTVAKAD